MKKVHGRRIRSGGHVQRRTTSVDVQVGRNVRRRRIELGMSQTSLAEACAITFQQIQKYENGANRVSASRLWQFSAVLGVSVPYFFEGLGSPGMGGTAKPSSREERRIDDDTAKIARRIASIADENLKRKLKTMLNSLAEPKPRRAAI